MAVVWTCEICGKKIKGPSPRRIILPKRNHVNAEWRRGLRKEPYNPYVRYGKQEFKWLR